MRSHAKAEKGQLLFFSSISPRDNQTRNRGKLINTLLTFVFALAQEKFRLPCMYLPKHDSRIHEFLRKDTTGSGCGCRQLNSVPADHWHFVTRYEGPVMIDTRPFQAPGRPSWHPNHFPNDPYKASVKDKTKTQHQLLGSFSNEDDGDINEGKKAIVLGPVYMEWGNPV